MAKIGSKILETRLRKGLTLDRVADDTNISVRFLAKIENDDFTGFPGEPYVVGFIRNYADYLGLEPEEIRLSLSPQGRGAVSLSPSPRERCGRKGKRALLERLPVAESCEKTSRTRSARPQKRLRRSEGEAAAQPVKPKRTRKRRFPANRSRIRRDRKPLAPNPGALKTAATDIAAAKACHSPWKSRRQRSRLPPPRRRIRLSPSPP